LTDRAFYTGADVDVIGRSGVNRDVIYRLENALSRFVKQHAEMLAEPPASSADVEFHFVDRRTAGLLSLLSMDQERGSQKRDGN